MLVEDNVTNLMVMRRMLADRLGHRVVTAGSFQEAVNALRSHAADAFDMVVCDIGLPDGNGLDLMPHIRASHPHARAVALTGYGTEHDVLGTTDYWVVRRTKKLHSRGTASLESGLNPFYPF